MRRVRRPSGEDGSTIPMLLLCVLIAMFLVAGVTAASSAFLAQRSLQADCDGAVVAAASGIDPASVYGGRGLGEAAALPLATEQARAAVADYRARGFPADRTLTMVARVDGEQVILACRREVRVPFGVVFGVGGGLVRTAVSSARSPLRP